MGLPGDLIAFHRGRPTINGEPAEWQEEPAFTLSRDAGDTCADDSPGASGLCRVPMYEEVLPSGARYHVVDLRSSLLDDFAEAIRRENRTLKRAITNQKIFSGIGNAYSDEIFHAAKISPIKRTSSLSDEEVERLFGATVSTLTEWRDKLIEETGDGWPNKITAFRPDMAVHGKFEEACPVCGDPVQRIRYADNETNYCATCQTEGKLLADRALSRILKDDWPKTLEDWES